MNATTAWAVSGDGGRLRCGSRLAATFGKWEASYLGGSQWRIIAKPVQTDAYWLEHGSQFRATLRIGRGEVTLRTEVVMTSPTLVFDMEVIE